MKVTAIIPDNLVAEVQKVSGGKNITDSLIIALNDWLKQQKIFQLNKKISSKPLRFSEVDFGLIREQNRR